MHPFQLHAVSRGTRVWADEVGALFMQLLEGCAWVELLGDATVLESPKRQ